MANDSAPVFASIVKALRNGAGQLLVLALVTAFGMLGGLAAYAVKLTLENVALKIDQVSLKIDDATATAKDAEVKINMIQTDVGRLQERASNTDRRLDQLEGRKR